MIKKISIIACLLSSDIAYCMNIQEQKVCRKKISELNIQLYNLIKNRHELKTESLLKAISSLIEQGADPDCTYRSGKTPLGLAVEANNLEVVNFFTTQSRRSISAQDLNPRKYSLVHDQTKLKQTFAPIIDYMLKLETHNEVYPDDQYDCVEKIFVDVDAQALVNAFCIDKLLEDRGFPVPFKDYSQCPLYQLLQKKPYQKTFNYIFASRNIADYIPQSIIKMLPLV